MTLTRSFRAVHSQQLLLQSGQSHSENLCRLESTERVLAESQALEIAGVQSHGSHLVQLLHLSSVDASEQEVGHLANERHTHDIQSEPEISDSVTPKECQQAAASVGLQSLALDWLLAPKQNAPLNRLLAALVRCEAHANKDGDVWFAEDCRQAWIAFYKTFVAHEFADYRTAEVAACYQMFGVHPANLEAKRLARRAALLGPNNGTLPAKRKPVVSVRPTTAQKGAL